MTESFPFSRRCHKFGTFLERLGPLAGGPTIVYFLSKIAASAGSIHIRLF
tara:strand:+ start:1789 stop:1938 length:150 start_codon:yes stop_codon:yes gene_type:complete